MHRTGDTRDPPELNQVIVDQEPSKKGERE